MRSRQGTSGAEHDRARRIVAVATHDPLHPSTFSGLSARLFGALADEGAEVVGVASRQLRVSDVLTGAVDPGALLRRRSRSRPRVRPEWFWSRRAHERLSARLDARLARLDGPVDVLQIGTHVRSRLPGVRQSCFTDCTVPQAVAAGEFSISRASAAVIDEAVQIQREVLGSCHRILLPSQWVADSVVDDLGIDAARVEVVGAGANITAGDVRSVDPARPSVLFVGADWEQKGGPLILDAFRLVRARVPAARLVVVGCRPAIDEPGVEVVGRIDRREPEGDARMRALYASATCFCIASRFDAFPNVLLEAGLLAVPVVSTDEGSRAEVVVHGETGLLASSRDAAELAALLERLLTDPDEVARMGAAAAARITARFTWPVVARRILAALDAP